MKPKTFHTIVVSRNKCLGNFPDFSATLYKSDKKRIRPLDKEIENIFHPDSNKLFRNGDVVRWLLLNEKHEN